jgi:hypothetical protein
VHPQVERIFDVAKDLGPYLCRQVGSRFFMAVAAVFMCAVASGEVLATSLRGGKTILALAI